MTNRLSAVHRVFQAIEGRKRLLVLTHNNPDPDAIASAWGLSVLIRSRQAAEVDLAYGGFLGRAENRAMVELLQIPIRCEREIDFDAYDGHLMVDVQPQTQNHALPSRYKPLVVIDHHPAAKRLPGVAFRMVRTRHGATSTILTELLLDAGVGIDAKLATALLYGIKSDTRDLGRHSHSRDISAFMALFQRADLKLLGDIENAKLPRHYFADLRDAISGSTIRGDVIVTRVGVIECREIVAEMADLFLRVQDVNWAVCYGYGQGEFVISIRTADSGRRADRAILEIVDGIGTGGGHAQMAAGRIPAPESAAKEFEAELQSRIHRALRVRRRKERPLVNGRAKLALNRSNLRGADAGPGDPPRP